MRFLTSLFAACLLAVSLPHAAYATPPTPQPVKGDCESWRPLLEKYGLPFDRLRPIMWRESRCSHARNYNRRTRDDSFGVLQINRWGSLDRKWTAAGFPRWFMDTPEGGVAAAAFLYHACNRRGNGGLGPWTRPYRCRGGWPL
jgi:hypothetical protein